MHLMNTNAAHGFVINRHPHSVYQIVATRH